MRKSFPNPSGWGKRTGLRAAVSVAIALIAVPSLVSGAVTSARGDTVRQAPEAVAGSGVHFFSTTLVHSQEPTETGMIQRSSDIVTLTGDLNGHLLYHPTGTFDYAEGTLVNTGTQYFSGTVLGSAPVILYDNRFRFEVDLETGATIGRVYLGRSLDSPPDMPWHECTLEIVGTGLTPEGDATFSYEGTCARVEEE